MSDDIVARLRDDYQKTVPLCAEAADEIERLRAELAAMTEDRSEWERVATLNIAENERLTAERDAAVARAKKAEGLLLDAYHTWGEWPQETLARIAAALNKGGEDE